LKKTRSEFMTSLLRATFAAALVCTFAASSTLPSQARTARYQPTRAFDGIWSVQIITQRGDCDRAYRYSLRIWYGRVYKNDNDPNYQVAGAVARGGGIAVAVSGGGRTATGTGRLARTYGRGVWHTDTGSCSGVWTAEQRAAGD
jgi:hypothetical protein